MRPSVLLCVAFLALAPGTADAQESAATPAPAARSGTHANAGHTSAASKQPMDPKAMEELMARMATPGPFHERFKKMEGSWDLDVKVFTGPDQPPQDSKSTSVFHTLMDGRYMQEEVTGEMLGTPYNGMGLTGYDNVRKKYVTSWIDNQGTGIMSSTGTPDATGRAIHWTGESSDPMTGKAAHFRMEMRFPDDDHVTYEIYVTPPGGREVEVMSVDYSRKR